jgi:hypothetical protein
MKQSVEELDWKPIPNGPHYMQNLWRSTNGRYLIYWANIPKYEPWAAEVYEYWLGGNRGWWLDPHQRTKMGYFSDLAEAKGVAEWHWRGTYRGLPEASWMFKEDLSIFP